MLDPKPDNLLSPVSVTSDGQRLYVADLGHNRVLIWNSIPTANQQPADVVVGQPDMTSATPNNVTKLCASNGTDADGNATYPGSAAPRWTSRASRFPTASGCSSPTAATTGCWSTTASRPPTARPPTSSSASRAMDVEPRLGSGLPTPRRSSADSLRTPLRWPGTD